MKATTQFDQAGIQCNLNGFLPNLTGQIQPGIISMKNKYKVHNTSEVDSTSKSTSFIKLLHF